jgi:hypothetical protein
MLLWIIISILFALFVSSVYLHAVRSRKENKKVVSKK